MARTSWSTNHPKGGFSSPITWSNGLLCKVAKVILHGVVSAEVQGLGFKGSDLGFEVWGLRLRVEGPERESVRCINIGSLYTTLENNDNEDTLECVKHALGLKHKILTPILNLKPPETPNPQLQTLSPKAYSLKSQRI